jgi:hypothetical protein
VRRPLAAAGVALLLLAAAVTYVLSVGPLAPASAARSVVFVAISRTSAETDAREIEVIDLDAGTRQLFGVGARVTTLALSSDRRSLYVALAGGQIAFLDATTGSQFRAVDLGEPDVVSLVPTPDGHTLFAVTATDLQSSVVPIDLLTTQTRTAVTFDMTAGPAAIRGDALVVPLGDNRRLELAFLDVHTGALSSRVALPLGGSLVPPAAFPIDARRIGILAFDGGFSDSESIVRMYLLTDPSHWDEVYGLLGPSFPDAPQLQPVGIGLQAAAAADGTIHVCTTVGTVARRYVVSTELMSTSAGTDCGPMAGGDQILMAKGDPPQLLVLDAASGRTIRTVPLAGVPAGLAH